MARQNINIGVTSNDGTGDPLRDAMDKVNDNFVELYANVANMFDGTYASLTGKPRSIGKCGAWFGMTQITAPTERAA